MSREESQYYKALKIPVRVIETESKPKNQFGGKAIVLFLCLFLILGQIQILSAFEAHIINVTATIINDVPASDPPGGQFCNEDIVTAELTISLSDSIIWYTLDGTDPICYNSNGQGYVDPIVLPEGITVLKARSCHDAQQSIIISWTFDISSEYCEPSPNDCMKINEVYYHPDPEHQGKPNEEKFEWIELYNNCEETVNLKDWYIEDNSGGQEIIHQNYPIDPHEFVIIAANAAVWNTYWDIIPANAIKIALGGNMMFDGLDNDGDRVFLYDNNGNEIDAVSWGTDDSAFVPPVDDVDEGHSIARNPLAHDTDTADDWEDLPSPNPGTNPHSFQMIIVDLPDIDPLNINPIETVTLEEDGIGLPDIDPIGTSTPAMDGIGIDPVETTTSAQDGIN
ncbi:lamin tail domain-containing protein [Candidatus Parcubacteria bacterium]|nr:lamin tail domain-containing protein [Candidatus Parcubacteria bacterium]